MPKTPHAPPPPQVALTVFQTVCQRTIHNDPAYYPTTEYNGRIIHFCTGFCLEAFRADPDRFYAAHSRKKSSFMISARE